MFQSPLGEVVKETSENCRGNSERTSRKVSIPSRGSGKGDKFCSPESTDSGAFQSPLGEVVKETTNYYFEK